MLQVLLLAFSATAFVPSGRSNCVVRVAPLHALDVSVLHALDASTLSDSTLALASFQDFRDGIADVVRPFAILAAVPAFGIALIPVTLAAALARAAAAPAARVAEVLESIPAEEYQKLLLCKIRLVRASARRLSGGLHY